LIVNLGQNRVVLTAVFNNKEQVILINRFFVAILASFMFCTSAYAFGLFDSFSQPSISEAILSQTQGLNPRVLSLALEAYKKVRQEGYDQQQVLTIVDYTKPSTEPRMWVIDLKDLTVAYQTLVAHGKNSGGNYADSFSNRPQSLKSSVGVYLTQSTYVGHDGYSLRLDGLEPGFNNNALSRDIIVHPANYVSQTFADQHHRLGRSWGCFAVNPKVAPQLINNIKNGTVIFAYYPEKQWLEHSQFIGT
jgi:hypothetical protein